jgi:hypothetical protein
MSRLNNQASGAWHEDEEWHANSEHNATFSVLIFDESSPWEHFFNVLYRPSMKRRMHHSVSGGRKQVTVSGPPAFNEKRGKKNTPAPPE